MTRFIGREPDAVIPSAARDLQSSVVSAATGHVGAAVPAVLAERGSATGLIILKGPMSDFVRLAAQSDLPPEGEAKEFTLGDKVICVANVNGTISAMDNVCLHRGGPLGQGVIEGDKLVCPWHGWQWDPKTGEAAHNPGAKVAVYPLKVEGADVLIER